MVRAEDTGEMAAFRAKMNSEEAKAIYQKRGAVAEFPNLWIKEKFGWRQFSVRGWNKVRIEATWVGLAYNIQPRLRLRRAKPA